MAEDAWNSRDPAGVTLAYTPGSQWRNRAEFIDGRAEIEAFLTRKWVRELDYSLIKEVWTHAGNRIAARVHAANLYQAIRAAETTGASHAAR